MLSIYGKKSIVNLLSKSNVFNLANNRSTCILTLATLQVSRISSSENLPLCKNGGIAMTTFSSVVFIPGNPLLARTSSPDTKRAKNQHHWL